MMNRRTLLTSIASAAASTVLLPQLAQSGNWAGPIEAIAFDAFPIFDARPIAQACERLFPGRGAELMNAWRTRQFEYQWLRVLGGHYANFWDATQDALMFSAASLKIAMTNQQKDSLMQGYLELKAWPDVKPALELLRTLGLKIAFLSNATNEILEAGVRNSKLENMFDHIISTDRIRSYKPDPRAYRLGVETLGLAKEEILFVAFAGWDVAGAKWFGYPTFWNNRQSAAPEQLGAAPEASGATLDELVTYLRTR